MLMLGYAWQKGWVPVTYASAMMQAPWSSTACRSTTTQAAFEWGRRAAHDLAAVQALTATGAGDPVRTQAGVRMSASPSASTSSPATRTRPMRRRYRDFVDRVRAAEAPLGKARS